jgi:hypothetical protein
MKAYLGFTIKSMPLALKLNYKMKKEKTFMGLSSPRKLNA